MRPTITMNGDTYTFQSVDSIDVDVNCGLDFEGMPSSPPSDSILYDFNGVTKIINIEGRLIDTDENTLTSGSAVTIDEQRKWLEKNIDGFQSGGVFVSDYTSTWNGSSWEDSRFMMAKIRFRQVEGKPAELAFNITLFVGDV
jgi:hypothetical protein